MARIKTYAVGSQILPSELNNMQDDYEGAFATYKSVWGPIGYNTSVPITSLGGGTDYAILESSAAQSLINSGFPYGQHLDPAHYAAGGGRAAKFRLRVTFATNQVAPAPQTITFRLVPITYVVAASNIANNATAGTPVPSSSLTWVSPPANFTETKQTADFTIAAAGLYTVISNWTVGSPNTGAIYEARADLQVRQA